MCQQIVIKIVLIVTITMKSLQVIKRCEGRLVSILWRLSVFGS
jgi:hypothetical protein